MTSSSRGSIEANEPSALQDAVEDGGRQILVVEHLPPFIQRLIGSEDHGPFAQVAVFYHMEKNVGGVLRIGQVADLFNDQERGGGVGSQRLPEPSPLFGVGGAFDYVPGRA